MTARIFVDTNIHVYAFDTSNKAKAWVAVALLDQIGEARSGMMSAQVLSEFFNTVTRKLPQPLTFIQATARVEALLQVWTVTPVTELTVLEAIRGVQQYQMSFWDAQIWAAAKLNQATVLLSEDFQDGAFIEGVRVLNPFRSGFALNQWL